MAEKPVCSKCGTQHWFFVRCDEAPVRNQVEKQNAVKAERLRVVPEWRPVGNAWAANGWRVNEYPRNEFKNPPKEAA